ncbi:chromatin accessibility complex protein 1 [Capsicum galapagoense]
MSTSLSRVVDTMAREDQEGNSIAAVAVAGESHQLQLPVSRLKKIMKLDQDIKKVNSEALHLIASSTELFLESLAEKSAQVALEKNRKTMKLEHLRVAVKRHQPTSDFLLDSLPMPPSQPSDPSPKVQSRRRLSKDKPLPSGTRRIEAFFHNCT